MTQSPTTSAYDAWAEYYDVSDADRSPFVDFYAHLVTDATSSILELGCGTGTIGLALRRLPGVNRAGSPPLTIGVDLSLPMLRIAHRKEAGAGWIAGDLTRLPVRGAFPLVICCFNTLQHLLTDDAMRQALHEIARVLHPDGRFAFDIYQPNLGYLASPYQDRLARALVDAGGRHLEIREDAAYDASTRLLTLDWRLVTAADRSAPPLAETRYHMRQFFPDEIGRFLAEAGLQVVSRYGDFDRQPFGPASRKQILVCRRT